MNKKYFDNIKQLNKFLKSEVFDNRYDLTISTMKENYKRTYKVEYTNDNVILYINKKEKYLEDFLYLNRKIRNIEFVDFDTSEVKDLASTFSELDLDGDLDLSSLDFSNVERFFYTFSRTKVKGDIILPKKMPKLKYFTKTFKTVKANKIIIDSYVPSLISLNKTFYNCNIDELILKIHNAELVKMNKTFKLMSLNTPLDLTNIDFSNLLEAPEMIDGVKTKTIDFGMNKSVNSNDIGKVIVIDDEDNNQEIKCTKKMAIFLGLI